MRQTCTVRIVALAASDHCDVEITMPFPLSTLARDVSETWCRACNCEARFVLMVCLSAMDLVDSRSTLAELGIAAGGTATWRAQSCNGGLFCSCSRAQHGYGCDALPCALPAPL